jgi:DsbC/DsbD-like thiol-disulfide interchange protein
VNLKKNFLFKLLILFIFYTGTLFSQDTPDKIVDIKLSSINKNIRKDSLVTLELFLNIKNGWHINSNKPLDSNFIPTIVSLNDTSSFKVKKIDYPVPQLKKLSFSENELSLYEDQALIKIQLVVNKNYKKKNLTVNGKVQYQPCNDQTCLFPATKSFSVVLAIN